MMDTPTISLVLGTLCAGLIWWAVRVLTRQTGKSAPQNSVSHGPDCREELSREQNEAVYRKLFQLRVASFSLCLLAAVVLYFRLGTFFAILIAGSGCLLQFFAYRIRTKHIQAVRKATEAGKMLERTSRQSV